MADLYEEITRFIRRTKRCLEFLQKTFGKIYSFSEEYFFINLEETLAIMGKIEDNLEENQNVYFLKKNFYNNKN